MSDYVPDQLRQFARDFLANPGLAEPKPSNQAAPPWPKREPLRVVDIHSFLQMDIPPREMLLEPWLLEPWLPAQGLTMLYGKRGLGKTNLALAIAYAVSCGGALLSWRAPKPRKALYIDGEMLAAPLQERLAAIVRGVEREPAPGMLSFITPDLQPRGMPDLATAGGQADLAEVMSPDTELIIVDSLSSLVRGEGRENDAESWLPIAEWALTQRVAGRSVLFLHHANRRGEQRGTSKREDLLDTVLALRPPPEHQPNQAARFEIHMEKSRGLCAEFVPIEAELIGDEGGGVTWTYRALEETRANRILRMQADGMSVKEIAEELKVDRSTVYRALKRSAAAQE